jgi:hypothetical protein
MAKITATIEAMKQAQATNKRAMQCFVSGKVPTNVMLNSRLGILG